MLKLATPWNTYNNKVKALFEYDPDIEVGELVSDDDGYHFDIGVKKHNKYLALSRLLPLKKKFGNVEVSIIIYDEENNDVKYDINLYKVLFEGNRIVKDIKTVADPAGYEHNYVRFQPDVVQFYNDDLSDYSGNYTGLAMDIAKEVFEDAPHIANFCTVDIRENQ